MDSRTWAEELPEAFVQCRDFGHVWKPHTAWWDKRLRSYGRVLRCTRCTTERTQWLSSTGLILSGAYDYPDGYSRPPGSGYVTARERAELRLISTLRLVDEERKS